MLSISSDVHEYEECLTKFLTSVQWNKNAENCVSELLTLNDGKNTKKESTSYEEGNPYSDEPLLPPPYASNSIVSPKADSRITIDAFLSHSQSRPTHVVVDLVNELLNQDEEPK